MVNQMPGIKGVTAEAQFTFLSDLQGVYDASPKVQSHLTGSAARMTRKGLVVSAFNSFEGFVKSRFKELSDCVEGYNKGRFLFEDIPEITQKDILGHVLKVTANYVGGINRDTDLNDVMPRMNDVGNFLLHASSRRLFSETIGWWSRSNISYPEIIGLLKRMRVKNPTTVLVLLLSHFRQIQSDKLRDFIEHRFSLRHKAAHDSEYDCYNSDLDEHVLELRELAFVIDVLSTTAASLLACGDGVFFQKNLYITEGHFSRHWEIIPRDVGYAAYRVSGVNASPGSGRAYRVNCDLPALINAVKKSWKKGEYIVIKDNSYQIDWWIPWSCW